MSWPTPTSCAIALPCAPALQGPARPSPVPYASQGPRLSASSLSLRSLIKRSERSKTKMEFDRILEDAGAEAEDGSDAGLPRPFLELSQKIRRVEGELARMLEGQRKLLEQLRPDGFCGEGLNGSGPAGLDQSFKSESAEGASGGRSHQNNFFCIQQGTESCRKPADGPNKYLKCLNPLLENFPIRFQPHPRGAADHPCPRLGQPALHSIAQRMADEAKSFETLFQTASEKKPPAREKKEEEGEEWRPFAVSEDLNVGRESLRQFCESLAHGTHAVYNREESKERENSSLTRDSNSDDSSHSHIEGELQQKSNAKMPASGSARPFDFKLVSGKVNSAILKLYIIFSREAKVVEMLKQIKTLPLSDVKDALDLLVSQAFELGLRNKDLLAYENVLEAYGLRNLSFSLKEKSFD